MGDKNGARNDRLTLRKTNEEVLRKKMQLEAQTKCLVETQQFGDCAKKNGMLVIFSCRKENSAMSDCLDRHTTEKDFEKLLIREGIDPASLQKSHK